MACQSLVIATVNGEYIGLPQMHNIVKNVYAQESWAITAGSWKLTIPAGKQ
jgi:hypothetical protein